VQSWFELVCVGKALVCVATVITHAIYGLNEQRLDGSFINFGVWISNQNYGVCIFHMQISMFV